MFLHIFCACFSSRYLSSFTGPVFFFGAFSSWPLLAINQQHKLRWLISHKKKLVSKIPTCVCWLSWEIIDENLKYVLGSKLFIVCFYPEWILLELSCLYLTPVDAFQWLTNLIGLFFFHTVRQLNTFFFKNISNVN